MPNAELDFDDFLPSRFFIKNLNFFPLPPTTRKANPLQPRPRLLLRHGRESAKPTSRTYAYVRVRTFV